MILLLILLLTPAAFAGIAPARLRCEYLARPVGIDVVRPRLSWVLESPPNSERGQRQSAYRVLVAASPAALATHHGDLWDSGKVLSTQQNQIEYAGKALASGTHCYWKVQVWDRTGQPSAWSETASWSMGLLGGAPEWKAKWIFDPASVVAPGADSKAAATAHNGFLSAPSARADSPSTVALDLGSPRRVDAVRLWPAQFEPGGKSFHFPLRYRIEASARGDFSDAVVLVDRTAQDEPAPPAGIPVDHRFAPVSARHVRVNVVKLRREAESVHHFALAELEVMEGAQNVARGAKVTAAKPTLQPGWATEFLVDGRTACISPVPVIQPVSAFRRDFRIDGKIRRATAYATAEGVYQLRMNGQPVDNRSLAPEFTSFQKRLQYQTYDVTHLLRTGANAVDALLGAGWYAGRLGLFARQTYGTQTRFLMRLEIELADGRKQIIVTDEEWKKHAAPPQVSADMLDGVIYDARREPMSAAWSPVSAAPADRNAILSAQPNEPIRPMLEVRPVAITEPSPGVYIFDLGRNMVGWCRLRLRGTPGQPVRIRHAEALRDDGSLYVANLRGAPQVDVYIPRSRAGERFEPLFTYHGFRYVELTGLSAKPQLADVTGIVAYSAEAEAGRFATSDPMLNQLMSNILWTQRGNMYSVPTDCPQRDERLGWMGDIQTFSQIAIFNLNMASFFTKWLRDVRDDQWSDGRFPDFAPNPNTGHGIDRYFGTPAWGDAGVIVPWRMYQNFGDRRLLAESFESARGWVDYVHRLNPDLIWKNGRNRDYNDWLNADTIIQEGWPNKGGEIPKPIFATAFWAHSTQLVARMAEVLGRTGDAARYGKLFDGIRDAFNRSWVRPDGAIESETQSAYALALHFDLLPPALRKAAAAKMIDGGTRYGGHLSTGIHGTNRLMLELAREGRADEAYRLLQLRTFPSWGFMIENGATTIWERWDGYVKGRGFQSRGMNSLNHWALGAVGEWMWRCIVGLNPDDAAPGYERFVVKPLPGGGLTSASGTYDSIRGKIAIAWTLLGGAFTLEVSVPPNSEATIHVPARDPQAVTEGGKRAVDAPGLARMPGEAGTAVFRAGSGNYTFRSRP